MIKKAGFLDFIHAAHIKRWHIVKATQVQTLAEHHWLVTVIALELYTRLRDPDGYDPRDIAKLAMAAMFHDSAEIRTGDLPTPGKNLIREMSRDDVFERIDHAILPEIPYIGGNLPTEFTYILGLADIIESYCWIKDNGIGNYTGLIAERMLNRIDRRVEEAKSALPAWDWGMAVSSIMHEILTGDLDPE